MTTTIKKYQSNFRTRKAAIFNDVISLKYNEGLDNDQNKKLYPWHLKIIIESRFLFSSAYNVMQEKLLQSEIKSNIKQTLSKYCKIKQVVELEKQGLKELHWYINSCEIDYLKVKEVIDTIKHKRFIWFYLDFDEKWSRVQAYS